MNIVSRVEFQVNEEGSEEKESEAPAATPGMQWLLMASSFFERPPHFVADHPFMFVVIDTHSKVLLFVGHVTKPR